jgi:integrase
VALRERVRRLAARLDGAFERTLERCLAPHVASRRACTIYARDLGVFFAYAAARAQCRLPASPDLVADFLIDQVAPRRPRAAFPKVQTMNRRATAIATLHRALALDNPCRARRVRSLRIALRHQWGYRAATHGRLGPDILLRVIASMPDDDLASRRDRALFLVGFAAGLGAAELRRLTVADIDWQPDILTVRLADTTMRIRRETGGLAALCPLRALEAWLAAAGIADGPVFRPTRRGADAVAPMTYQGLARIVKARLRAAGVHDRRYSVGSFRTGFLASAQGAATGPFRPGEPVRVSRFFP